MSRALRRVSLLTAAALLFAGSQRAARAEESPWPCAYKCAAAATSACVGQDADWCAAWYAGCVLGCGMQ